MNWKHRWQCLSLATLGLALSGLTGCQTWVAGQTLPSGHYLDHQAQYFPETPAFPLTRELAQQEAVAATPQGGLPEAGRVGAVGGGAPAPFGNVAPPQ